MTRSVIPCSTNSLDVFLFQVLGILLCFYRSLCSCSSCIFYIYFFRGLCFLYLLFPTPSLQMSCNCLSFQFSNHLLHFSSKLVNLFPVWVWLNRGAMDPEKSCVLSHLPPLFVYIVNFLLQKYPQRRWRC